MGYDSSFSNIVRIAFLKKAFLKPGFFIFFSDSGRNFAMMRNNFAYSAPNLRPRSCRIFFDNAGLMPSVEIAITRFPLFSTEGRIKLHSLGESTTLMRMPFLRQ